MDGWKIGLLVVTGLAAIGAAVCGVLYIKEQNEIDRELREVEDIQRRIREEELMNNGFKMDDKRTAEELQTDIRERFEELGLEQPENYWLGFSKNGLLVKVEVL